MVLLAACQQCAVTLSSTVAPPELLQHNSTLYAACKMRPSTTLADGLPKVYGQVLFKQVYPEGKLQVLLRLSGFSTEGDPTTESEPAPKAVHIHQYGDLSQGCTSTGGHYNPHSASHPNHPGDFGNFEPQEGKIIAAFESTATLFGGTSAVGRAVVVHVGKDDLGRGGDAGSLLHGNAGPRLGCCIIGISSPALWNAQQKHLRRRQSGK